MVTFEPDLWRLGWDMMRRDLAQRYRGTVAGGWWPFVQSAAILAVFTLVFAGILRVRWPLEVDGVERPAVGALMIFAGLIPYFAVAEVVSRAPNAIVGVPNLVKKVRFPLVMLPAVTVGSALVLSMVNVVLLCSAVAFLWHQLPLSLAQLPLLYLPLALFLLGAAWSLSALGVFFRDLAQIGPVLVQLLLFLAPICYPIEQVPDTFRGFIEVNPLTFFASGFRDVILRGQALDWIGWLWQCGVQLVFAWLGWQVFRRTRRMFADLL